MLKPISIIVICFSSSVVFGGDLYKCKSKTSGGFLMTDTECPYGFETIPWSNNAINSLFPVNVVKGLNSSRRLFRDLKGYDSSEYDFRAILGYDRVGITPIQFESGVGTLYDGPPSGHYTKSTCCYKGSGVHK